MVDEFVQGVTVVTLHPLKGDVASLEDEVEVEVDEWFPQITIGNRLLGAVEPAADNVSRDSPPWVVMTMCGNPRNSDVDGQLLPLFPHTVEVPALRHRIEDINQLVPKLLRRLTREASLTCSPETLRQLMRLPWMGNVEQLRQVLSRVAQQRRSGTVELGDLPPECTASSRRQLSQMEALERDAIANALIANAGSKVNAANDLGMSRATIYRKIRDYGIALAPPY